MSEVANSNNVLVPNKAPGPQGFELIRTGISIAQDALKEFDHLQKKYGNIVSLDWPIKRVMVFSPTAVKHILKDNHQNFVKSDSYEVIKPVLGEGLVTSEGALWKKQRRLILPEFKQHRLVEFAQIFVEEGKKTLSYFETDSGVWQGDISIPFMDATFNIAGKTFFGRDVGKDSVIVRKSIQVATEIAIRRLYSVFPLYKYLPCPSNFTFNRAVKNLDRVVYDLITYFKENPSSEGLMSRLLSAKDPETGESMSTKQLRDEVMTLLLAGHETTANSLIWTFFLLGKNPDKQEKIREELEEVLKGRTPDFKDLDKLPYLNWALQESMRIYPAVPMISKDNLEDDVIDGFQVPKGSTLMMPQYIIHRREDLFPNPLRFEPERWSPERKEEMTPFSFFPFAEGPRKCIGHEFATIEASLLVAMILQKYRVKEVPGFEPEIFPNITLQSKNGMHVILEKI